MAKSFSITERLTGPANPVAVKLPLGSGGLSAATYYYRVVAIGGAFNGYYSNGVWLSAPSAETAGVTTDTSNRKVGVYFDNNVSGAVGYYLLRTPTSGNYDCVGAGSSVKRLCRPDGYSSGFFNGVQENTANCPRVYPFTMDGAVAALVPGETLTQAGSGATAIVALDPAGASSVKVYSITGTWNNSGAITGSVTGAIAQKWSSTGATCGNLLFDQTTTQESMVYLADGLPCVVYNAANAEVVTPQDIWEYLVGAGKTYCASIIPFAPLAGNVESAASIDYASAIQFRCNIEQHSDNTTCVLRFAEGILVHHLVGKLYTRSNGVFQMGFPLGATASKAGAYGAAYLCSGSYAHYTCLNGPVVIYDSWAGTRFRVYDSAFVGYANIYWNNFPYRQYGSATKPIVLDSIVDDLGRPNYGMDIRRSRVMFAAWGSGNTEIAGFNAFTDVVTDGCLAGSYVGGEIEFADAVGIDTFSTGRLVQQSRYAEPYTTCAMHLLDFDYSGFAAPIFISTYTSTAAPTDMVVLDQHRVYLTIVDELTGVAIAGATVECRDASGYTAIIVPTTGVAGSYYYTKQTHAAKTDTNLSLWSGSLTVGAYYLCGDEVIKVASGSGTGPYVITRGERGSTKNWIGDLSAMTPATIPWLLPESLATDASGLTNFRVTDRRWAAYDYGASGSSVQLTEGARAGTLTLTVRAPGYKTRTLKFLPRQQMRLTLPLSTADAFNVSDRARVTR